MMIIKEDEESLRGVCGITSTSIFLKEAVARCGIISTVLFLKEDLLLKDMIM